MNQIATYDMYCTVLFYSVHHFCAGTALALCPIALLSGACAIIPMASCTSLCQTYCTTPPPPDGDYPQTKNSSTTVNRYTTVANTALTTTAAAATQVGAPETWGPRYLVKTKVAPHSKAQGKPPSPKPLHPPLKLDTKEHTPRDEWATHYIIRGITSRKNAAAKITVSRHLPHTTQVYELTAPNILVTRRQHDERYTI